MYVHFLFYFYYSGRNVKKVNFICIPLEGKRKILNAIFRGSDYYRLKQVSQVAV